MVEISRDLEWVDRLLNGSVQPDASSSSVVIVETEVNEARDLEGQDSDRPNNDVLNNESYEESSEPGVDNKLMFNLNQALLQLLEAREVNIHSVIQPRGQTGLHDNAQIELS